MMTSKVITIVVSFVNNTTEEYTCNFSNDVNKSYTSHALSLEFPFFFKFLVLVGIRVIRLSFVGKGQNV